MCRRATRIITEHPNQRLKATRMNDNYSFIIRHGAEQSTLTALALGQSIDLRSATRTDAHRLGRTVSRALGITDKNETPIKKGKHKHGKGKIGIH